MNRKRKASPHKREVEAIRELIDKLNGRFWLTSQSQRLYGSAGIPDIYVHLPNRWGTGKWRGGGPQRFWVEVKCERDKLSAAQAEFAEMERACGGTVVVGGLDAVIDYLREKGVQIA